MAGSARLSRTFVPWDLLLLGSIIGGLYSGLCLLRGMRVLAAGPVRLLVFSFMSVVVFGTRAETIRCGAIFLLLNLALEGMVNGFGQSSPLHCAAALAALGLLCLLGFYNCKAKGDPIDVELSYGENKIEITALRDTGNLLTDPLTGQSVLIVDAPTANKLTGLTAKQLSAPTETLVSGRLPGLRLIPYRTIGQNGAFLLALRMDVKIGDKRGSYLVGFSPASGFGENYQSLAGGVV